MERRASEILDRVQVQVLPTGKPRAVLVIPSGALPDDHTEDLASNDPNEKLLSLSLRSASELATPLADRLFGEESNAVAFSPKKSLT